MLLFEMSYTTNVTLYTVNFICGKIMPKDIKIAQRGTLIMQF